MYMHLGIAKMRSYSFPTTKIPLHFTADGNQKHFPWWLAEWFRTKHAFQNSNEHRIFYKWVEMFAVYVVCCCTIALFYKTRWTPVLSSDRYLSECHFVVVEMWLIHRKIDLPIKLLTYMFCSYHSHSIYPTFIHSPTDIVFRSIW